MIGCARPRIGCAPPRESRPKFRIRLRQSRPRIRIRRSRHRIRRRQSRPRIRWPRKADAPQDKAITSQDEDKAGTYRKATPEAPARREHNLRGRMRSDARIVRVESAYSPRMCAHKCAYCPVCTQNMREKARSVRARVRERKEIRATW